MTSTSRLRPSATGYDDDPWDTDPPRRRRRRLLVTAAVLVVVVGGASIWTVWFSSLFGARTVDVRGEHTVSAAQIRAAAGIGHGTPLVRLDTAAAAARVERLPDVASARVSTSFPSTVTITVVERAPVGVVQTGSSYALVDRTGAQYRTVGTRPARLPLFVLAVGTQARPTGAAVSTVAAALPASLLAKVASIQALDPASISVVMRDGVLVQWGSASRSADKAQILPALLATHPGRVDVSDPDVPFTH